MIDLQFHFIRHYNANTVQQAHASLKLLLRCCYLRSIISRDLQFAKAWRSTRICWAMQLIFKLLQQSSSLLHSLESTIFNWRWTRNNQSERFRHFIGSAGSVEAKAWRPPYTQQSTTSHLTYPNSSQDIRPETWYSNSVLKTHQFDWLCQLYSCSSSITTAVSEQLIYTIVIV
jgi:hypothetical protein